MVDYFVALGSPFELEKRCTCTGEDKEQAINLYNAVIMTSKLGKQIKRVELYGVTDGNYNAPIVLASCTVTPNCLEV